MIGWTVLDLPEQVASRKVCPISRVWDTFHTRLWLMKFSLSRADDVTSSTRTRPVMGQSNSTLSLR